MGLLDDAPYSANHSDAIILVQRLTLLLGNKAAARTVTARSGIVEGEVDWDGPMADVWPGIVAHAAMKGTLRRLVEEAQQAVPADDELSRLLADRSTAAGAPQAGAPQAGRADYWATARLWKREPLIDRADLRSHLQRMIDDDEGCRALFVIASSENGTAQKGKSQTRRFMSFLAEKQQMARVNIIDVSARAGPPMTVQELAQQIASTFTGVQARPFDPVAQEQAIVTQFMGWLTGVSADLTEQEWLVFDGFTSTTASGPALQLVHDLAVAAADYLLGPLRIAICGYEGVPPAAAGALTEPLHHPTDDEVKAFFDRMSTALTAKGAEPAAIDIMFDDFVSKGGPIHERELAELGPSALRFVHTALGVPL